MECFGFQNGLMGMEEEIIPYFCNISDPDPGIYYGRNSSGRISGYTGCAEFWQTKERRLEILKDSHAGAFAIISCTVYFLMYIGVYSCLSVRSMEVIAYSFMLSRTLSGLSVVTFPQARKKGMVADFSESASTRITRMVLSIYLIVLCFLIPLTGGICGIGCVISAGVVFGYYYRMAMKNFGGVTGDLCGYFLQVCELVMALVVVVVDIVVKSGIIK